MGAKKKPPPRVEKETIAQFLQSFEENRMIDDHGDAIIGKRDRKPVIKAN